MEPRVLTRLIPDFTTAAVRLPSRQATLIAPFLYKDESLSAGDGATKIFETEKKNVLVLGAYVTVDGVTYAYTAGTPGTLQFTMNNEETAATKAQIEFGVAPDDKAKIIPYYMYNEDADGNTIMNRAFEIVSERIRDYEGVFGKVQSDNPMMICVNIARSYGLTKFNFIPVPYLEDEIGATPTSVDITDALAAAAYVSSYGICHIFKNGTANQLALAHCDYYSADERSEYRVLFASNPYDTLALQKSDLASYISKRAAIANVPEGAVEVLVGADYFLKSPGYLSWGALCRQLTFTHIATSLTRKTLPMFKLVGKYLRDEREELQDAGGMTFRTIGVDTVQCSWAKSTAKSGLPEEEEISVVMLQDYVRDFYEDELDRRFIGKTYGIPKEFDGFDQNDIISIAMSLSIQLKRRGLIVSFQDPSFQQNAQEPRQLDGSIPIKWPFPANWIVLNISSYN